MDFYFARHGEGEHNLQGIAGEKNAQLTDRGRKQAQDLAETVASSGVDFDEIWTSELPRAVETAKEVAGKLKAPLIQKGLINEIDYGDFASKPFSEFATSTKTERLEHGVESPEHIYQRAHDLLAQLHGTSKKVLTVGHQLFAAHILLYFGVDTEGAESWLDIPHIENGKLYNFNLSRLENDE
jgi:broad specificity phosphatase PhoE